VCPSFQQHRREVPFETNLVQTRRGLGSSWGTCGAATCCRRRGNSFFTCLFRHVLRSSPFRSWTHNDKLMRRDKQRMTLFVRLPLAGGPDVSCYPCGDRVKSTEGFIRELSTGMGRVSSHPELTKLAYKSQPSSGRHDKECDYDHCCSDVPETRLKVQRLGPPETYTPCPRVLQT
jgi:hypothetical protein